MKKVLLGIIIFLLVVCLGAAGYYIYILSTDISGLNDEIKTLREEKDKVAEELRVLQENNKNVNNSNQGDEEDIYDKLLKGDYSGVAGDYVNSEGKVITLLSNGLLKGEAAEVTGLPKKVTDGSMLGNGTYTWNIVEEEGGGAYRVICPVGVSIKLTDGTEDIDFDDDNTKIRLVSGNGIPMEEDIYFKK